MFRLALKNIRRSLKDYAIYFFTLVLGVAIFYVFNALDSQTVMLDVNERVKNMLELMNVVLGTVSVFVSLILGALIIYASRFLIKRRSKEFGIYLTLGMGKRKISLILLIETFFIGLFSLAVGLLFGVIVSQLTSVLVANMFDANMTNFHFVFSASAFLKTLLYFGIIYLIVMIFNAVIVSRQKLINLLSSSRRSEKIKLKNPWLCTAVFIIASVMLGIAYYLVTDGIGFVENLETVEALLIPIGIGVVATFLLFWSLSGLLLRIFMSFKGVYYKGLNSFILRQFSSKINTTVISMGFICLMLFVTICVLGSALSINQTLHAAIEKSLPADIQIESHGETSVSIKDAYLEDGVAIDDYLKDVMQYATYDLSTTSILDNLGSTVAELDENDTVSASHTIERFIHVSDYNRIGKLFDLPEIELADDEYAIIGNYRQIIELRDRALAAGVTVNLQDRILKPKFDRCIDGTFDLEMDNTNGGIIIIPDNLKIDPENSTKREVMIANFANPDRAEESEAVLMSLSNRLFRENEDSAIYFYGVTSRQSIIDNSVGTSALVTFVGLYLGVIFLISSAAILALKELSESTDNRQKYTILRKIGVSEKMLHHALFWQIFIFFLFPLLIAIIHSIFGLRFCNLILSSLGGINIAESLPGVMAILLIIYGGYFLITYLCSKSIINGQRN